MLNKNHIVTGLIAGLILPATTWIILGYVLNNKVLIFNKPAIPYLIAILINLFIIKYLFRKGSDQTGIGMILSTFVAMIAAFLIQTGHLR
jgi:hypothetical protein